MATNDWNVMELKDADSLEIVKIGVMGNYVFIRGFLGLVAEPDGGIITVADSFVQTHKDI